MDVRGKLVETLAEYFNIGDSYAYNLTRVKSAFACGTVGLDDFEEFDDETVEDIASYIIDNGVTVHEQKSPCSLCGYGGKHLDSPPCTQCPTHPKQQPNTNQRNSNASNVQEWISVKDRLPEEKVNCIVRYQHAYCDDDGYWAIGMCFYDGEKFQFDPAYKVTHWMPLPSMEGLK